MEILTDDRMNTPIDESDELYHWGIKGMKWGVRRYQTKDGSLTPAGLKRYNKDMEKLQKEERRLANERATKAKLDKLDNARKRIEDQKAELKKKPGDDEKAKQKSISEMTNEEVAAYKQRMQNERDILKFQSEISAMTPKEKSKIEKFTDGIGGQLAKTVWNDVGKGQLNKFLEKNLGIKKPLDELGKLKKEADIWRQKADIAKSKKNYGDDTEKYENAQRRRAKEDSIRKNNDKALKRSEKNAYKEDARRTKAKEEAYAKAKKQVDDYNTPWEEREGTYSKKGSDLNWTKTATAKDGSGYLRIEQIDRYEATGKDIIGKGTSRYEERDTSPIIDGDYREVVTNYPAVINRGERAANNVIALLEDKRMKHSAMNLDNDSCNALMHYGIKGMKWGVNRFYNKDGTRTAAGKKRENEAKREKRSSDDSGEKKASNTPQKKAKFSSKEEINDTFNKKFNELSKKESDTRKESDKAYEEYRKTGEQKYAELGKKLSEETSKLDLELDNIEADWEYELDKFYIRNET